MIYFTSIDLWFYFGLYTYIFCMIQKIDLPVSVVSVFDHKIRTFQPKKVLFEGREHLIVKTGFHHTEREGRTLYHIFSVASESMFFRLVFNSETLAWKLSEVHDGETN